jgi:hypothetical protein
VTQPTFAPVPAANKVRPTTATSGRKAIAKKGLRRTTDDVTTASAGTQAPGEGFALTLAEREVETLHFAHHHDAHDVALGLALVAAKRASLLQRGPTRHDVLVALGLFGLGTGEITREQTSPFLGLAHSYAAQRRFVDAISPTDLELPRR